MNQGDQRLEGTPERHQGEYPPAGAASEAASPADPGAGRAPQAAGKRAAAFRFLRRVLFVLFLCLQALFIAFIVLINLDIDTPASALLDLFLPDDPEETRAATSPVSRPDPPRPSREPGAYAPSGQAEPRHGGAGGGHAASMNSCGLSGAIRDSKGAPVPGAVVWASIRKGPLNTHLMRWDRVREAATDHAGRFVFSLLEPGVYQVLFFHRDDFVEMAATLGEEKREARIEAVFKGRGDLAVEVFDAQGLPVQGACAELTFMRKGLDAYPEGFRNKVEAVADEKGRLTFTDLPAGPVSVRVTKPGYARKTSSGLIIEAGREALSRVAIEQSAAVDGIMLARGRPLAPDSGAVARLYLIWGEEEGRFTRTVEIHPVSPEGRFSCEVHDFDCRTALFGRADGYRPLWLFFDVKRGERKQLEMDFTEKGGLLEGRIVLPETGKLQVREILVSKAYGSEEERLRDDRLWEPVPLAVGEDGRFSCSFLDRCPYVLSYSLRAGKISCNGEMEFTPDAAGMIIDPWAGK